MGIQGDDEKLTAVISAAMMAGADEAGRKTVTLKSIGEITREYRDTLENWVVSAANGNIKAGGIARPMRSLIVESAEAVYIEGLREGGVADEELDADDDKAIGEWILSQTPYIYDFAEAAVAVNDLSGDERTAARDVMMDRVDLWVRALEVLGKLGYSAAKENMSVTWQIGKTEDNCKVCLRLDGQTHRLKWFTSKGYIPREPGSSTLDCHGYNCDCSLVDSKGGVVLP
jgi:hypothetical protein